MQHAQCLSSVTTSYKSDTYMHQHYTIVAACHTQATVYATRHSVPPDSVSPTVGSNKKHGKSNMS